MIDTPDIQVLFFMFTGFIQSQVFRLENQPLLSFLESNFTGIKSCCELSAYKKGNTSEIPFEIVLLLTCPLPSKFVFSVVCISKLKILGETHLN